MDNNIKYDYFNCFNFLDSLYDQVNGYDFYKYIFPNNEKLGELNTDYSKPNAIYLYKDDIKSDSTDRELKRRIMLNDTWESDYMNYVECNNFTLCSGLSYRGRSNKLMNAQSMNALVFDIDGVGKPQVEKFFERVNYPEENRYRLPRPTFLVLSGTGMHLYYVFDKPIDLFPNIKLQFKELKYELTSYIWKYQSTSKHKSVQYQSINQGFRMVGSTNSKYGLDLVAFKTGDRISLEYLNKFVSNKADINKRFNSKVSLEKAKVLYPEWYERVIVKREKNKGKWKVNEALYKWWLGRTQEAKGGHRYYTMLCTVIYADKCGVPYDRLKEDLYSVYDYLKDKEHVNTLEESDLLAALEVYGTGCHTTPIDYIEKITDIRIDKNKRNGRRQTTHLKIARNILEIMNEDGGQVLQGRPLNSGTKESIIKEWRKNNPNRKKADCIRELGLSKKTVYKWW